jgi:uncharacterized membrane protein YfcA
MTTELWIGAAGLVVGVLYGLFGVGSAFATPMLAMIGIPGMAAVVGPLPALLPGSIAGAWSYSRSGRVDWLVARRTLACALPATVVGVVASQWIGGPALVAMSGVILLGVGIRVLRPAPATDGLPWAHEHPGLMVVAATAVGFLSGLLGNGGGFLLVPLFLLAVGLEMNVATGTSLVAASLLTVPILVTHALIGDINWVVAGAFALGLLPGTQLGAGCSRWFPTHRLQTAFGVLLVGFALWFLVREAAPLLG